MFSLDPLRFSKVVPTRGYFHCHARGMVLASSGWRLGMSHFPQYYLLKRRTSTQFVLAKIYFHSVAKYKIQKLLVYEIIL